MKKVSVIVPVYNVEKYLAKCLDSLVNQTLKDIEIIVVNDGSPDESQKIIDEYVKKYPKLIKSFIKENGGQGTARNYGLQYATGKYIAYVDSDDWIENNMLEILYKKAIKDKSDIVICGYNIYNEKGVKIGSKQSYDEKISENVKKQILLGDCAVWNKLYRKEIIEKNNISFRSNVWYEDVDFTVHAILKSSKISKVNDNLYNYLIRKGSTMNNSKIEKNLDILFAFDSINNIVKLEKKSKLYHEEIEFLAIMHILVYPVPRILCAKKVSYKTKIKVIKELKNYLEVNFKDYKKNKYLKKISIKRQIMYYLINGNFYYVINLIFYIKSNFKGE